MIPFNDEVNVSTIDTDCNLINNHFTKQTDSETGRENECLRGQKLSIRLLS